MKSLLKQVIIRCDFSPITNFETFTLNLRNEDFMHERFYRSREIKTNTPKVQRTEEFVEGILEVNETVSVLCFSDTDFFSQRTIAEIGNSFIAIKVFCDEKYESISPYIDFLDKLMNYIVSYDSYVHVQRMGIRKIDGHRFKDFAIGNKIFKTAKIELIQKENCVSSDAEGKKLLLQQNMSQKQFFVEEAFFLVTTIGYKTIPQDKKRNLPLLFQFTLDSEVSIVEYTERDMDIKEGKLLATLKNMNKVLRQSYQNNVDVDILATYEDR